VSVESVFPQTVFRLLGIPVKDSVLQALFIVLALSIFAVVTSRRYRVWGPRPWQLAVEYLVETIENLIRDTSGRSLPQLVPFLTTMILFIATANVLGIIPLLQAPTRDLNTTVALALVALGSWIYYGVQSRGIGGYVRSFVEPVALMLPLNILGFFSRALSMTLRLFGNVVASEVIGAVLFALVPVLGPLPLTILGLLTSVLQALVFTVLTFVFIVDAMGQEEERAETTASAS
jgi:F-type H+-transporting ATPase subunit a